MIAFCQSRNLILLLLALSAIPVRAQNDRHYNSLQYGLRGIIMNGAMVAGVNDNSAIYYNPAAIANTSGEGLDLSLFALSAEVIRHRDAFGEGLNGKDKAFKLIPGLITFLMSPFKNDQAKMGFGVFTRQNFQNELSFEQLTETDGQTQLNQFRVDHTGRELWMALSFAYRFPKNVSLGISQYFSFLKDHYAHDISYSTFGPVAGSLLFQDRETLNLEQKHFFGMINKLGLTWSNDGFKFGFTLTTPTYVRMGQSADLDYTRTEISGDSTAATIVSFQERGKQRAPFSITTGLEWSRKGYILAASVDYYHKVLEYDLVSTPDDGIQIPAGPAFKLTDSRSQVFNVNLGWEIPMTEKVAYLGGFRTNFNFNDQPAGTGTPRLHLSYFDIYHITTGFKGQFKKSRITFGLDYAFSFQDGLPQLADLSVAAPSASGTGTSSVVYSNFTIMITYNFLMDKFSRKSK